MPSAGEDEAGIFGGEIEDGLRGSGGVVVYSPGDEHGQDCVAPLNGFLDDLAVVRVSGDEGYAVFEGFEFVDAFFTADTDDFIFSGDGVLDHVLSEFS